MRIELKIPEVGESITEVEIGEWLKQKGDSVEKDESLVTMESAKATLELPSPDAGTLVELLKEPGQTAAIGEIIGYLEKNGDVKKPTKPKITVPADTSGKKTEPAKPDEKLKIAEKPRTKINPQVTPVSETKTSPQPMPIAPSKPEQTTTPAIKPATTPSDREEEIVPMSRLRRTVAEHLVAAQHNAALLTTFNEIDMGHVMTLRKEEGEDFQKKYKVKLGIMSFFVKACVDALKLFPQLNAEVRGTDIVYHNFYDIGIAVSTDRGLVVPVLRNAERLSFAEIETAIADFATRARENKLTLKELQGGTFTITNGGVFGSLFSTPIVNPPQTGILGMHTIQERPIARDGQITIRPMMYIALTYDHRVVDGREAVTFLKRIKEVIENPARMLMEI